MDPDEYGQQRVRATFNRGGTREQGTHIEEQAVLEPVLVSPRCCADAPKLGPVQIAECAKLCRGLPSSPPTGGLAYGIALNALRSGASREAAPVTVPSSPTETVGGGGVAVPDAPDKTKASAHTNAMPTHPGRPIATPPYLTYHLNFVVCFVVFRGFFVSTVLRPTVTFRNTFVIQYVYS